MELVTGDNIRQGANTDFISACHSAARPCLLIQMPEQKHARPSHLLQLSREVAEKVAVERSIPDVIILLEPGKGCLIPPSEAQCAICEDPFRVDDMTDDFLDAPLAGGVPVTGMRFRNAPEEGECLIHLYR